MKQIGAILKKFTIPILIVISLLFLQAMCDLSLPDYTANIINIGIQSQGVEDTFPEVLRPEMYNAIIDLATNKESISNLYEYRESLTKKEAQKLHIENGENLYIKKENTKNLDDQITREFSILLILTEELDNPSKEMIQQFHLPLQENQSALPLLTQLDANMKTQIFHSFSSQMENYETSMIKQIAIESVKKEYQKLNVNIEKMQMSFIINNGIKMVGIAALIMMITLIIGFLSSRIGAKFAFNLRNVVVKKIMSFSNQEFEKFSTASLITRSTNDIQQIQMLFVMLLRMIIYSPILGIGALLKVMGNSMNWILALAIGLIITVVIILFSIVLPKFKLIQKMVDKLNLVSREILTGIPVIRAFSTEIHEEERFDQANTDLAKTNLFCNRVMGIMMPTMMLIMNGVSILIVWVGAKQIDFGTIQVGTLMAFITYAMQIIMSFLVLSMVSIILPRAWVSVKRIGEVLSTETSIKNAAKVEQFLENKKGIVEFKNVYFRYPNAEEDVLKNISFKATPGTTTAFIGSTGSGKSTLINLIPRFYDITSGKIMINGIDIQKCSIQDLRERIGYVPQKGNLFSGTIRSNILFGAKDQSEENMKRAAEIAQATEFIEEKGKKFDNEISQGGTNVSGGQRQRLSIARAIAINPEIYIFDDSFSALDYKTDVNLRKALNEATKEATIFIVAQRISTIMHADQIIVLDKGEIVGIGTHQELLKSCQIYKEIALSQLKEDELYG